MDETLEDLYAKQRNIELQVLKRKKDIAKENGDVVDSLDELVCKKHPEARFEAVDSIPASWIYAKPLGENGFCIYQCEDCLDEKNMSSITEAYDCPNCGFVYGEFEKRPYRSSEESWMALAGREGENYHCRVCGIHFGSDYWLES